MKKVYVLNGGCIGDRYVIAVFSSLKKAQEAEAQLAKTDTYYRRHPEDLEIEVFELNGKRVEE